jgi:hypothetical protein
VNYEKNPELSKKLAKEQQHLRKMAKRNPDKLSTKDRNKLYWQVDFDNYDDHEKEEKRA